MKFLLIALMSLRLLAADGDKPKPKDLTVDDMENYSRVAIQLHAAYEDWLVVRDDIDKAVRDRLDKAEQALVQARRLNDDKIAALQEKYSAKGCTLNMISKEWMCPETKAEAKK